MSVTRVSIAAALLATLVVAGCTNTRNDFSAIGLVKGAFSPGKSAQTANPAALANLAARAMASTSGPLATFTVQEKGLATVIRTIESNGPYRTWAAWGTSDRRSVTTRSGMVTATRGLGFDLMSADVKGVLPLITQRRDGTTKKTQRYLDGENQIIEITADCAVTRGETRRISVGELNQTATQMTETCRAPEVLFISTYMVNSGGHIVQSEQWLGPFFGYARMQQLR